MKPTLKTLGTLTAVLAAGLAFATVASGCGHHRPDPAHVERMVSHHVDDALDDLKATPEQRQVVLSVKDRLLARVRTLRADRPATMKEALALWEASSFDRARAHALVDARLDALRALAHEAVDGAGEIHDALTPEQRAQVAARVRRHAPE